MVWQSNLNKYLNGIKVEHVVNSIFTSLVSNSVHRNLMSFKYLFDLTCYCQSDH